MKRIDDNKVQVPAGEYYLGDPCYFFTHDDWGKVLQSCHTFSDPIGKSPNGRPVLGFSTAHGDGVYEGSDGFAYGVDAGMIGLIPVDGITREKDEVERLCNKVKLPAKTICKNNRGRMTFGSIEIDTLCEDDGEDD